MADTQGVEQVGLSQGIQDQQHHANQGENDHDAAPVEGAGLGTYGRFVADQVLQFFGITWMATLAGRVDFRVAEPGTFGTASTAFAIGKFAFRAVFDLRFGALQPADRAAAATGADGPGGIKDG